MRTVFLAIGALLISMIFVSYSFASIKINEIYPVPTNSESEWIELYNNEDKIIDLKDYNLYDLADNKIKINASSISAFEMLIATSSSILNNNGDTIFLKYLDQTVDIATYSGSFNSEKSYGRCPDGKDTWFTLSNPTKNKSNEIACLALTPTITPTMPVQETPTPTATLTTIITPVQQIQYDNVYISEVMVNPEKGQNEWIELYNDNDFSVILNNWYIDDLENSGSSPKLFSIEIKPKNYASFDLSSSIFNNDADEVRVLDFNKVLKDSFEYKGQNINMTYGRTNINSDNFCLQTPSKNLVNSGCISPIITTTIVQVTILPTPTVSKIITSLIYPTSSFVTNSSNHTINNDLDGEILGENTEIINISVNRNLLLVRSLSFVSFSYSLLTILSVFIRIKSRIA